MNMKTLAVLILMGLSLSSLTYGQQQNGQQQNGNQLPRQVQLAPSVADCKEVKKMANDPEQAQSVGMQKEECLVLERMANNTGFHIEQTNINYSGKGEMVCIQTAGFTLDYKPCLAALQALNFVINAEGAMELQQKVRTDLKTRNIQEEALKQANQGNIQTGVFDASIEKNRHEKLMMQEKALAYSAAVTALGNTYFKWPKRDALKELACQGQDRSMCSSVADKNMEYIVANEEAKKKLILIIIEYIAKGTAAGIAMGQFNTAAQAMQAAKDSVTSDQGEDVMMERCVFNPTDPLCVKPGERVSGSPYTPGDFTVGDGSGSNSFNMGGTGSDDFGIAGDLGTIGNDETVAATNSPFEDEAKKAGDILNPAGAASMQPGNPGAGAGGGGVGGGGGGGSASLGGDLEGADKEGDKDANLKATKSSGNYNLAGGSGYSAVKGGKAEANPFASLFDAKSSGGIEEDRSIASSDIDGAASGLFQKISKRYNLIQAEKRIEANNLE